MSGTLLKADIALARRSVQQRCHYADDADEYGYYGGDEGPPDRLSSDLLGP